MTVDTDFGDRAKGIDPCNRFGTKGIVHHAFGQQNLCQADFAQVLPASYFEKGCHLGIKRRTGIAPSRQRDLRFGKIGVCSFINAVPHGL